MLRHQGLVAGRVTSFGLVLLIATFLPAVGQPLPTSGAYPSLEVGDDLQPAWNEPTVQEPDRADRHPRDTGIPTWYELPPPARSAHAAAWDSRRGRMIVFGGRTGVMTSSDRRGEYRNDLWVLSSKGRSWDRLEARGVAPSPRIESAAIYDPTGDRVLIFGGEDSSTYCADLWELSLKGHPRWRRIDTRGESPAGRSAHTMTLVPERSVIILFGGRNADALDDCWELALGREPSWTRLNPSGQERPAPRWSHSAVYVPDLHGVVMMCGERGYRTVFNDTWLLTRDGANVAWIRWTPVNPEDGPCRLREHIAVYDGVFRRIVVMGGDAGFGFGTPCHGMQDRVWTLSIAERRWTSASFESDRPRARTNASAVFDPGKRRLLIYGGSETTSGQGARADTWALNLDPTLTWSRVQPEDGMPGLGSFREPLGIYDPRRDRILILEDGVVWSYALRGDRGWERLEPTGDPPPTRRGSVLVYDSHRDRMIVCGGTPPPDQTPLPGIWALSLGDHPRWSMLVARGTAPAVEDAAAIYDPILDRMIVYGGGLGYGDYLVTDRVWSLALDGAPEWLELDPGSPLPAARAAHTAILDSRRSRLVTFGGGRASADFWILANDVWALGLSDPAWTRLAPTAREPGFPAPRAYSSSILDPGRDRMIVLGGYEPGPFSSRSWDDVWAFSFSDARWSRLDDPVSRRPPLWREPLAFHDPHRDRMLVWELDHLWAMALGSASRRDRDVTVRESGEAGRSGGPLHLIARPNPSRGGWEAELWLPGRSPGVLELIDLAGRRIWRREIGDLGPGSHHVAIDERTALGPGVYLLRLVQSGVSTSTKVVRVD